MHLVLLGSGKVELRALVEAAKVVFKHTSESLVNRLNKLPHTFKKDVRGGTVDADDAFGAILAQGRWPVEVARARCASAELRSVLRIQRSLVRFRAVVKRRQTQRALWVSHFDKAATPEGCLDFPAFSDAVLAGVENVPAEALILRLYNDWGSEADALAARERASRVATLASEIATFVVQKNFILRCWKHRAEHSQGEALTFLRGKRERWSQESVTRLSAALALRRWRRHVLCADATTLFQNSDPAKEQNVGMLLEARRGFAANSRAFANVMVKYGLDCDETETADKVMAKAGSHRNVLAARGHDAFPNCRAKKKKRRGRRFV